MCIYSNKTKLLRTPPLATGSRNPSIVRPPPNHVARSISVPPNQPGMWDTVGPTPPGAAQEVSNTAHSSFSGLSNLSSYLRDTLGDSVHVLRQVPPGSMMNPGAFTPIRNPIGLESSFDLVSTVDTGAIDINQRFQAPPPPPPPPPPPQVQDTTEGAFTVDDAIGQGLLHSNYRCNDDNADDNPDNAKKE